MANNAVPTQGISIGIETTVGGGTYTPIGELQTATGPAGTKPEIQVTHFGSTAQEYIAGLPDYGSFAFSGNFTDPEDAGQAIARQNFEASGVEIRAFELQYGNRTGVFSGYVSEFAPDAGSIDSKIDINGSVRVTGPITWS